MNFQDFRDRVFSQMPIEQPAEPSRPDVKSVNLEVVRDETGIRRDPWRPTTLTVRKFLRICHLVEEGATITSACREQLISYSRLRFRVARSPRLQERLKEAEACRDQVWRAEALASIRAAFPRNWVSGMTYLERKYPNEFSLRNVTRTDDTGGSQMIGDAIPAERLAEYGQLMLEMAEENRAREIGKAVKLPVADQSA
jgi:hypothetical protein